jgi:hypothetical protein
MSRRLRHQPTKAGLRQATESDRKNQNKILKLFSYFLLGQIGLSLAQNAGIG